MSSISLRYDSESNHYFSAIKTGKLIAVAIIFLTMVIAYSVPTSYPFVFMTGIPLLVLQLFASLNYLRYLKSNMISYSLKNKIQSNENNYSFIFAAGLAVKDGFFLIFLCFDFVWLLGGYIIPSTVYSFSEYVARLKIGSISGEGFLIFTIFFWLVYIILYFIGSYASEVIEDENILASNKISRIGFTLKVNNYNDEKINLNGFRIPNTSGQPLILWPGFFQNGFFYDIIPGEISIAEFLWNQGYDIWIFHPRGTANSGFSKKFNSMDDYASTDIPSIIDFVFQNTGMKPIFTGHSQGGISALMSLMGTVKDSNGKVSLSDVASTQRQEKLKGVVTLGSYLNFTFSKQSNLKDFVKKGLGFNLFGKRIKIVSSDFLLNLLKILNWIPVPVPHSLRIAMLNSNPLKIILFPLTLLLNMISLLGIWQFLYNIPNVSRKSRQYLFNKTIDASFWGILSQFHNAIMNEGMCSSDNKINYSDNYSGIKLPASIVTMEDDTLADPVETKKNMFTHISSSQKYFTEWKGQGHEDFAMNPKYFHQLLDAIKILEQ